MKIDVIIPTYNRATLIERAVRSVLAQSCADFHLYVVDDGSTDETLVVLNKYANHPKVTLLKQENEGVSSARNLAVKSGDSEWISFLDSDDEWLPNKLKLQTDYIKGHPEIRFLHAEEIWIRNGVRVNPKVKHNKAGDDLFERSLEFCLISPSTVMMKRELFNQHGGFNPAMTVCEDFDLWNKILISEKVGFIDEFVTQKYGGHEDQLSTKFVAMDYWRIKSLVALAKAHPSNDKIISMIKKKTPILLKGYLKHGHQDKHDELMALTKNYHASGVAEH